MHGWIGGVHKMGSGLLFLCPISERGGAYETEAVN